MEKIIPLRESFPKVREARQRLVEKAEEILEAYMATVVEAREAGETDVAIKALQYLLEHMPADEETGKKVLDVSVDKVPKKETQQRVGPSIKIGVAIGGLPPQKELSSSTLEVIDVGNVGNGQGAPERSHG